MATLLGPLDSIVYDTANALIAAQIPTKTANAINGAVTSWFNLVGDLLGVAADVTKPAPPSPAPPAPPGP